MSASILEGLPLTLLEAMSYGIPALVSDIPPHTEMIDNNEQCGFLFKHNSPEDAVSRLSYVLSCPENKLQQMGLYAQEKIKRFHNWDNISKKHEIAYKAILCR